MIYDFLKHFKRQFPVLTNGGFGSGKIIGIWTKPDPQPCVICVMK